MENIKKCTLIVVVFALLSVMAGIAQASSSGQPAAKTSDMPNVMQQMGKSKQDLLSYKAKTEQKLAGMKKDYPKCSVQVTITFAKPVARNELEALVKKHDLKVKVIRGRTIEKGQRGTLQVVPEQGNLFDEATFKHMTSSKTRVFKGFIELVGVVKVKNINHLIKDQAVFLVDPSYDGHLVFNPKNNDAPGAFWRLEDNRMVAY